jgi:hypothetical protein
MTILVLLLVSTALYAVLGRWTRRDRTLLGLRNEKVESTDDQEMRPMPMLRSDRYGLVGRPDQLVRVGRAFVPVEQKPNARRLQPSHVLQLAAQCLLVQEVYGVSSDVKLIARRSTWGSATLWRCSPRRR